MLKPQVRIFKWKHQHGYWAKERITCDDELCIIPLALVDQVGQGFHGVRALPVEQQKRGKHNQT